MNIYTALDIFNDFIASLKSTGDLAEADFCVIKDVEGTIIKYVVKKERG